MRHKNVKLAEKEIVIKEMKIKQIKNELLPKISPAWDIITQGETSEMVTRIGDQLSEIFPELKDVDLDDCYPSEIEEFIEAWIDVNFTGLKKLFGPVMSLAKMGQLKQELFAVDALAIQNIGKN